MKDILKVTGKGVISLKPDTVRVLINLTATKRRYDETLAQSAMDANVIKQSIEAIGFSREDLKTNSFNVNMQYENQKGENDVWKRVLTGYTYNHQLKLEFKRNQQELGKVLYALANSQLKPEIDITYTIKDIEKAKNELLEKAVEDSKNKAKILAKAAEVKLGSIINIIYSKEEKNFVTAPVRAMALKGAARNEEAYNLEIEPDDIMADDTVTIMWEIL